MCCTIKWHFNRDAIETFQLPQQLDSIPPTPKSALVVNRSLYLPIFASFGVAEVPWADAEASGPQTSFADILIAARLGNFLIHSPIDDPWLSQSCGQSVSQSSREKSVKKRDFRVQFYCSHVEDFI